MSVDTAKIVRALRDVVAKARETQTVVDAKQPGDWRTEPSRSPYEVEAYTRDHIVGRIAGLADAIEAMDKPS